MSDAIHNLVVENLQAFCQARGLAADLHQHTALGSLGISSLQLIELIFELESRFGVEVDEEQLARLQTVGDLQTLFALARGERTGPEALP